MPTSMDSSSKKLVTYVTDSNSSVEVKLKDFKLYMNSSQGSPLYTVSKWHSFLRLSKNGELQVSSLRKVRITHNQIAKALLWVEEKIMGTDAGAAYVLEKAFAPEEKQKAMAGVWGPSPGTIKIFSPDLISFFDGKSWRKLPMHVIYGD